ncbi:MAG: hypothetical protein AAFZ91_06705 [Pseudomonadota bacterium]
MSRIVTFALICLVSILPARSEQDWPSYGVMQLDDYVSYFQPGTFRTYSIEYDSHGIETILSADLIERGGDVYFSSSASGLSVGENYWAEDEFKYSKAVVPAASGEAKWDETRKRFVFILTREDLQQGDSRTTYWSSRNDELMISSDDVEFGSGSAFYDYLREISNGECCYTEEEYEDITLGLNSQNCAFVAHPSWEVICYNRHIKSGELQRVYYTRLEEGVS